jgi:hypothetical protein
VKCHFGVFEQGAIAAHAGLMETLIRIFSAILDFFSAIGTFFADLKKPLHDIWGVEMVFLLTMVTVAVAGMAAFGPWTRKRKPGEHPWQ